ncbi:hypothetical protein [Burkholderia anthina]|uniref:hypothetical protein n=1 Tax=Burkholderia anthina TaxID=179879 RepID=UPI0037C1905C
MIDVRIRGLVAAMNVQGVVRTVSSCEGHRMLGLAARQWPFVMFVTDLRHAARLAAAIRSDRQSVRALNYDWNVDAGFADREVLTFRLACLDRFFARKEIDHDFGVLEAWAKDLFRYSRTS